ncbi:Oidioi.mRNA.OKI2018_I69.chr2.g6298.t1.cds [Oikopleura dioica]|uniref:Oidioi.mRNA.OKI2018_I69.chr2.g6298.t1.cds n=1 Tax=Oikopleura dioica TaxID=34765 RepID=A0ABN7T9M8_OIKDI|nr:Oidioi.mRNA.OKI2018_I69.chr2.g6298.t1.cds [Oikopleura dioica]
MIVEALSSDDRKAQFRALDAEQGGNIDLQSLNKLFEQDLEAVEKFLEGIMNSVDLDNGGTLNFAEFLVLMVKQHGVNGVQRAFLSYDVDGSGSITRDELKDWMTRHGRFLTRRQVQMMVDAVDVNGDGEIDYGEFLNGKELNSAFQLLKHRKLCLSPSRFFFLSPWNISAGEKMFGGKSAVMPSFRLKTKRKSERPPTQPHPAPSKIFRQEDLHYASVSHASTMPNRKIEKRGRPPKTENAGSQNGRKKSERLNNNNGDRTSPPVQSPPQLPQIPNDGQIGWKCTTLNPDGKPCGRVFLDKADITVHIKHGHKDSKGKKTMKKVMIKKALSEEEEQEKALQANEASFRCFLCPNFIPSVSSTIQMHLRDVHPLKNLKDHCRAKKHADPFMNKFRCLICPLRTSKTATLGVHLGDHPAAEIFSSLVYIVPDSFSSKASEKLKGAPVPVHPVTPMWGYAELMPRFREWAPNIQNILNDATYRAYFQEYLKPNDRRLLTLYQDIGKFRSNVAVSACPDANQNSEQSAEDALRDQILSSALSNVTEIIQDSVNVNAKTAEEFNAEAQRIIRHYSDVLNFEAKAVSNMRRKLEKGKVVDEDFADLSKLVELGLSKKIPDFLTSKKFKGLLVEVFTDHEISLDQILSFDQSRELFRDFMSKEKSLEVLDFYLNTKDFAARFREIPKKDRDQLQKTIFKQLGAIGFSDNVKQQVEVGLKNPSASSFKLPARQALTTLQTVYLPLFLRSPQFLNFLNGIMEQAGLNLDSKAPQKNRESDTSSNSGINLTASFSRPELIYYRPLSGHLYLGHIDSLGRYRSETLNTGPIFAHLEAKKEKEKSLFSFKNFMGPVKYDEKTVEDAWRSARMFVADVTSQKQK